MQAYILLKCKTGKEFNIITALKRFPEVVEINGIWGKYDIFLKVVNDVPTGIDDLVSKLRSNEDITETYTLPILYGQGGSISDEES